jgi:hypothetical protein
MNQTREFIVKLIEFLRGKNIYSRIWWHVVERVEQVADTEREGGPGLGCESKKRAACAPEFHSNRRKSLQEAASPEQSFVKCGGAHVTPQAAQQINS